MIQLYINKNISCAWIHLNLYTCICIYCVQIIFLFTNIFKTKSKTNLSFSFFNKKQNIFSSIKLQILLITSGGCAKKKEMLHTKAFTWYFYFKSKISNFWSVLLHLAYSVLSCSDNVWKKRLYDLFQFV